MIDYDITMVKLRNFKSFRGSTTIDLEGSVGLYYLTGKNMVEPRLGANGIGKSTLVDAISWCLFGKTPAGLRSTDVKSWGAEGAVTRVGVNLRIGDRQHVVVRNAASASTISLDNRIVGQEQIDTLGLNYETMLATILLAQAQPMFLDLTPALKLALFSDVLSLQRWIDRSETASLLARRYEDSALAAETLIKGIEQNMRATETLLKGVTAQSTEWTQSLAQQIDEIEAEQRRESKQLEKVTKRFDVAVSKLDYLETELKAIDAALRDTIGRHEAAKYALEAAERDVKLAYDTEQHLRKALRAGPCPTCKQTLSDKGRAHLKKLISAQKDIVAAGVASTISEEVEAQAAKHSQLQASFAEFTAKANEQRQHAEHFGPLVEQSKAKLAALSKEHKARVDERNPFRETLKTLRASLSSAQAELKETQRDLAISERRQHRHQFWVKGFKDVELFIIGEVLEELSAVSAEYLAAMGLDAWQLAFAIEKETKSGTVKRGIDVTILCPGLDHFVKFDSWSGGEKQRLRLCVTLALSSVLLSRAGINPKFEMLDEPTRHLSREGVRDMCDFLAQRARDLGRRTFYADHQAVHSASFLETVRIDKTELGSVVR
jgi:DNA repair exonuclease SbcCD ATPase subunit